MLLENKNAVIYGAGGSLGGAVAAALAQEGARVFLTGRRRAPLQAVYERICGAGGQAEMAVVDAMDKEAVERQLAAMAENAGTIDISFNAIGMEDVQDIPLTEMWLEDFLRPLNRAMHSQFLTTTGAARYMQGQGSGVILLLTATPAGKAYPLVGGFGPACSALEGYARNLAAELGSQGIRVVCMRSAGSPDSAVFRSAVQEGGEAVAAALQRLVDDTMLRRLPLMQHIAEAAAFLASGRAAALTGTTVNLTCGTTRD